MEQRPGRQGQHQHGEQPTAPAASQAEHLTKVRALAYQRRRLDAEVERRPAVAAARRDRDDQLVNEPANKESDHDAPARPEMRRQRAKEEAVRQVAEGGVPAPAPEVAEAD